MDMFVHFELFVLCLELLYSFILSLVVVGRLFALFIPSLPDGVLCVCRRLLIQKG